MDDTSPPREKMANDPEFETSPNEKKIIDDQMSEKIIRVWNRLLPNASRQIEMHIFVPHMLHLEEIYVL